MRKHVLCLFVLVVLAGVSCSRGAQKEAASAEQVAYLQTGLNPGFEIRRAYVIRDERGMQAYGAWAEIYGSGLEQSVTMTWRMAGPKHAPEAALITSQIPAGVIRWAPRSVKTVEFQPSGR